MMKRFILLFLASIMFILPLMACQVSDSEQEEEEEIGEISLYNTDDGYDWERFKGQNITINVFNWGEYIADGLNDYFTELTGIKVNYSNYDTNETMYAKIVGGGASYDIIIPSDYMISRLIDEGLVQKLDFSNIPNSKYTIDTIDTSYDSDGSYSIPYTWGVVGLIYNTNYVDGEDVSSWGVLWDEKYEGKMLMFNNPRDAFAVAQSLLGYSLNTENPDEWRTAYEKLVEQKPMLYSYVADEVFNKMESGECWIAPYYAGDYLTMYESNEDLALSYPKEGANVFVDAVCIPSNSKNREAAEMYINFLCDPGIACENINYIWYFSPNSVTVDMEDYYVNCDLDEANEKVVPTDEYLEKCETFTALSEDTQKQMENLWLLLKRSEVGWWLYALVFVIIGGAVVVAAVKRIKTKGEQKRKNAKV